MSVSAPPSAGEFRHPAVRARRSPIAGFGSFADEPIPAGQAVLRYADPPASVDDLGPLNHSCNPNLGWADGHTLVTLREVSGGAELTTDYALCTADPAFVMMCHCETYRCRQVIEGSDWRIPQLRHRYAGYWAPSVARLIAQAP